MLSFIELPLYLKIILRCIVIIDFLEEYERDDCIADRMVLMCKGTRIRICDFNNRLHNYFCFHNIFEIYPVHLITPAHASVLVLYQIMQDIGQPFVLQELNRYIGYDTQLETMLISRRNFYYSSMSEPIWSVRYTIQTYYGYGIACAITFRNTSVTDRVIVSYYDGPMLVGSFNTSALNKRSFKGGFLVRFLLQFPKRGMNGTSIKTFRKYRHNYTYYKLTSVGETYNISVNTMHTSKRTPFYYKYIAVAVNDGFIKLTVRNIRTLSGGSYLCEYDGFAISNLWIHHLYVIGPYCTQHGTEPLVNDIRTFYSSKSYLTFLVYSYTFLLDIDISFQQTPCEGITNVCNLYCWGKGFANKQPKNHEIIDTVSQLMCQLIIIVIKQCVVVQRTEASEESQCRFYIKAKGGQMNTTCTFQTQNKFM